jgi:hypothetical protein
MVSAISARGTVTTASWMSCSMRRSAPSAVPAWIVPMPPGWPVPQALRRSSASAPRTSPIGMRSGAGAARSGRDRQRDDAILGAHGDEVGRGALQLARVLDQDDAIGGLGDFGQQRIDQRGLAGAGAARDEDVGAGATPWRAAASAADMIPARIIVEREHRDGGLADGEGRRRDDGRQQALEPLAPSGSSAETRGLRHDPRRRHDARPGGRCARRRRRTASRRCR